MMPPFLPSLFKARLASNMKWHYSQRIKRMPSFFWIFPFFKKIQLKTPRLNPQHSALHSMDAKTYPLLSGLKTPEDIPGLPLEDLEKLAAECRAFLMESIRKTGGHLGAALGVVELTVAMFSGFDFLKDRVVWDVGHQAHVHKLLTGRGPMFAEYGQAGGMSKFLERAESPYDHMGAGHASTSVSSALGMAVARDLTGKDNHVLAVLGDGALTGGLAYEALSMAGERDKNLIVILNDNGMSIDQNVGAVSKMFTRITSSDSYNVFRNDLKWITKHVPFGEELRRRLKHVERSMKDFISSETASFFESLNFRYFGPVDGHDLKELISIFNQVKTMRGPVLIHALTIKGKGLGPEVENTFAAHAVSAPASGVPSPARTKSWTSIFSAGLAELMAQDKQVVAITAAMLSNTGLAPLKAAHPDRVLDVGIAEANAFCSAAGMAIEGLKPFVTVYSTFSQRAFDQILHDIALQNLPVRMMMDRGGFVGADGATHHGVYDYSYLRMIPGLVHMAPADEKELRQMLLTAYHHDSGPIAMRFPRGETPAMEWSTTLKPIEVGQGELRIKAEKPGLLLIGVGSMVAAAEEVAHMLARKGIPASVINARFIKPLDEDLLLQEISRHEGVITLEENALAGGFGEGVLALMNRLGLKNPLKTLGVPDQFISFGTQSEQLKEAGLLPTQIFETALALAEELGIETNSEEKPEEPEKKPGKKNRRSA